MDLDWKLTMQSVNLTLDQDDGCILDTNLPLG